jgi:hypothetical protein
LKEDKIHEDEIEWLVLVYYNFIDIDEELTKEAYEKLIAYGLTDEQIKDIFDKIKTEKDESEAFDKAWTKQLERNEFKKYTLFEMIKVFFGGPYDLFKHFDSGLKELWDENYKTKFRQRLILLILGIIFYILFAIGVFKYYDHKLTQEIENIQIEKCQQLTSVPVAQPQYHPIHFQNSSNIGLKYLISAS